MTEFVPTPEQKAALTAPVPLLVLAGAGTGKTTVLTRRIADLVVSGEVRLNQVLALTFTDKAAAEMSERLEQLLASQGRAEAAPELRISTFNSFGDTVIRENLLRLGFDGPPGVLSGAAGWQLLASIFDDLTLDSLEFSASQVGAIFNRLLGLFSQCKNHLVGPDDLDGLAMEIERQGLPAEVLGNWEQGPAQLRELAGAYRRYEAVKQEKGLIDFGDQLYLPARLLSDHPSVAESYQRRFRHLFVDEYQDTNYAQRVFLLHLVDPATSKVMVIGDDDQSIYRWRGAVVQNILRFPEEIIFQRGQVETRALTLNRRSWPPVLDLANQTIAQVEHRHPKELTYHPNNQAGRAKIGHHVAASDAAEGRWIVRKIAELQEEAESYPGPKRGYGAFVVLCRKRSLFEPIGQALEDAGLPYELIGGTGFYGRWEVRDILSYLRVLANPSDDLAAARILNSPRWRLSSRDIFHLGRWVSQENGYRGREAEALEEAGLFHLLDALLHCEEVEGLSPAARSRLSALRDELNRYAEESQRLSLSDLVASVVEGTGYRRELRARPGFDAKMALLNLEKLENMAREFEEGAEMAGLAEFVEYVGYAVESQEDEAEIRPVDEETNTLKVMTIHQAKGLEFPVVFIPGLAAKTFPTEDRDGAGKWHQLPWDLRGDRDDLPLIDLTSLRTKKDLDRSMEERKSVQKAQHLEDEWRLFYVAITRAQRQLYFSRAHWYGGNSNPKAPSIFWDLVVASELSDDLGEEDCPGANPNLDFSSAETRSKGVAEDAAARLSALLLEGDQVEAWIEETASKEGYGRWTVLRAEADDHLASLISAGALGQEQAKVDLSCSGLMLYQSCPLQYRFRYVDGLPERPSPAASFGQEVHRLIEELGLGASGFPKDRAPEEESEGRVEDGDAEIAVEAADETVEAGQGRLAEMVERYRHSVFGRRPATYAELPMQLALSTGTLRGRIDRLDRLSEGRWEMVDFKSGKPSENAAEYYRRQLAIYALTLRDGWQVPTRSISAHLFFLQDGSDREFTFDDAELDLVRDQADASMRAIARGDFPAAPGEEGCRWCDYEHLCQKR